MKNKWISLVFVAMVFTPFSVARIGENYKESISRYGEPTTSNIDENGFGYAMFNRESYEITGFFFDGKIYEIKYRKPHRLFSAINIPLLDSEMKVFIEANSAGSWIDVTDLNPEWSLRLRARKVLRNDKDKQLFGVISYAAESLTVFDREIAAKAQKVSDEQVRDDLKDKGF